MKDEEKKSKDKLTIDEKIARAIAYVPPEREPILICLGDMLAATIVDYRKRSLKIHSMS